MLVREIMRFLTRLLFAIAVAVTSLNRARAAAEDPLIDVRSGTIPIIITAPHGGLSEVPGVPLRVNSEAERFVTGVDVNTRELAQRIVHELERTAGGKPYYVMARFRRRYIDANRSPEHAYETDAAKKYYDGYHAQVAAYCREIQNKFGAGLLIDVHGQAAHVNELLVGTVGGKTMTLLRQRQGDGVIVGPEGLVGLLNNAGVKTMPTLNARELNLPVYNGGYTVQTYGSHQPAGIDAVQFEFGSNYRKDERLGDTAKRAAGAIVQFYRANVAKKATANPE
jgi:N-formylglutamate amidohydrolase